MIGAPDAARLIRVIGALDLAATLAPVGHGRGDPTIRIGVDGVWRATRTPVGPATLHLARTRDGVLARAWGAGAEWVIERAEGWCGASDDPKALVARHPLIRDLARRHAGVRLPRTQRAWEALLPAICEQKVTGHEARLAFRGLVMAHGEPAPGPAPRGLRLPPSAATLAALPYFAYHRFGLERRRAEVIRGAARLAAGLDELDDARAAERIDALPGIGPWTVAEVRRVAFGDPDAVSVGDFHLTNLVAWALAGEPRADDARMLELLEPYHGQRGRVQRLLEVSGLRAPRYGPHLAPRSIAGI